MSIFLENIGEGLGHWIRRRQGLSEVLVVIALGIFLTTTMSWYVRNSHLENDSKEFSWQAAARFYVASRDLSGVEDAAADLPKLSYAISAIKAGMVHELFQLIVSHHPGVKGLKWLPRTSNKDSGGHDRFPILLQEPATTSLADSELDPATESRLFALLEKVRDDGQIRLVESLFPHAWYGEHPTTMLNYVVPIYRDTLLTPTTVDVRRQTLAGFFIMEVHVGEIIEKSLVQLPPRGIDFFLSFHTTADDPIYYHSSRMSSTRIQGRPIEDEKFVYSTGLDLADRHLVYRAWPGDNYMPTSSTADSLIILISGGILTLFVAAHLSHVRRYASALEKSRARILKLSIAVEQSPASIMITDTSGAIEYVNAKFSEVSGYAVEELLGQNPRILKSGRCPTTVYEKMWQTLVSGNSWRGEFQNKKKNGDMYWELASIAPLKNEAGQVTHYVAVKEDITHQKAMDEELRIAKRDAEAASLAKSDFLSTMSHEIRTPMNVVLGMSSVLLETDLDPEQLRIIQIMHRSGKALMKVVNDVLDFSRIETGRLTLSEMPFSPRQVVEEIASLMRMAVEENGLTLLEEVVDEVPCVVSGDDGRVRQVLINLLSNAIKFTQHGQVSVRLSSHPQEAETLLFSVSDTGIGIAPENINHIFEHFTQADSGITRRYGGTGLGLAISQKLVELMGGRIWVESQQGQGSTFFFTLPSRPVEVSPTIPAGLTVETTTKGLRILFAEDQLDNRLLFRIYLSKTPHYFVMVNDGVEAVARVRKEAFDLILMDIQMPNMDGYAATRAIRQWERDESRFPMVIVALSAHAGIEKKGESLAAGCDDHLTKPISKANLLKEIQRVARSIEAEKPTVYSGFSAPQESSQARHP